jgi:hypothetical protein
MDGKIQYLRGLAPRSGAYVNEVTCFFCWKATGRDEGADEIGVCQRAKWADHVLGHQLSETVRCEEGS